MKGNLSIKVNLGAKVRLLKGNLGAKVSLSVKVSLGADDGLGCKFYDDRCKFYRSVARICCRAAIWARMGVIGDIWVGIVLF